MDIIKLGSLPGEHEYEGKCYHCSTEVRFKRSESSYVCHRNEEYVQVDCPLCKRVISVDYGAYIKQTATELTESK